ncbi:MAG: hypothetical protein U0Y10_17385 [Spirosomataceae bacterium]
MFTLLTLLQLNAIVFRHAHQLKDGRIIVHSHPFHPVGKSPIQPNSHSENELVTLDALSNGIYEQAFSFHFTATFQEFTLPFAKNFTYTAALPSIPFTCFVHRGPPSQQV